MGRGGWWGLADAQGRPTSEWRSQGHAKPGQSPSRVFPSSTHFHGSQLPSRPRELFLCPSYFSPGLVSPRPLSFLLPTSCCFPQRRVTEKAHRSVLCLYPLRGPSSLCKTGSSQFLPIELYQRTTWLITTKTISNGLLNLV